MEFLNEFLEETQQSVVASVQELVESRHIKESVLAETQEFAQIAANHIRDPTLPEPPKFEGLKLEGIEENIQYRLVLDYFESIGLKFSPAVFRYESQHPNSFSERAELAKTLHLRAYDRTPLLVQLIEERRKRGSE